MSQKNGFSLVEVLVATAIFSLAALAFLNILGERSASLEGDKQRLLARIVAENILATSLASETPPQASVTSGATETLRYPLRWRRTVIVEDEFHLITVTVTDPETGRTLSELSTLRAST